MIDDLVSTLEPLIAGVAARYYHRYPMVSPDDVRQELWLWSTSREEKVREYLEDGNTRRLRNRLDAVGRGYCDAEKARIVGYSTDDLYFYSVETIRELLPAVFEYESWLPGQAADTNNGAKRKTVLASEGNNALAMLSDISGALYSLHPEYQEILIAVFRDKLPLEQLAEEAGITTESYEKKVTRAIKRLRSRIGGERPEFPTHRPSSAAAQAALRSQWDG